MGDTTARVIEEALAGSTPSYLASLEKSQPPEPPKEVRRLRRALKGDCHSHSDWSDGGSSISEMAAAARHLGHDYLVLTDHSPRLRVAHGLDADRLVAQLEVVADVNEELAPFHLLSGIEVDILEDGSFDQLPELLGELDLVVASLHSKLRMDSAAMTRRMIKQAVESPHVDVLGHCTGRLIVGRGRPQSEFDAKKVFEACATSRTAVEINSRPERRDPPLDLLKTALEAGCLLHISGELEKEPPMATDHGSPREAEGPEPGVAYGLPARQLHTQPLPATAGFGGSNVEGGVVPLSLRPKDDRHRLEADESQPALPRNCSKMTSKTSQTNPRVVSKKALLTVR